MNEFKITSIPYSVVIDKNNVVRWIGSGEQLTDSILSAVIKNEALPVHPTPPANDIVKSPVIQKKPVKLAPAFSFSVTFSDTTTKGSPGGGSSNYNGDYIDYSTRNEQLGNVLASVTGFGRKARIIANDTTKLNRLIDVNFSTAYRGKFDTALFKKYSNTLVPGKSRKNMIIWLLGDALKFDTKISRVTKDYYKLVVADSAKLHTFMSLQKGHASFSDDYFPKFEIVGYTLKDITKELENSAKMIISTEITDQNSYDLSLDISNIKTIQQTLAFHGLALKQVRGEVDILVVNFY
jgi:ribosomal protein S16